MLSFYIVATIVGGLLLAISLLGGSHHAGTETDGGGDLGHGTHADGSVDHGGSEGAGGETHGLLHVMLPSILSTRLWIHFLTFGGLTGLLLRFSARTGEPLTALISVAVGLASGLFARALFSRAAALGSGSILSQKELTGHLGTVLVPFGAAQTGKVRLQVKDETVDVLAVNEEGQDFAMRQEVVILGFRDGRAIVTHAAGSKE